MSHRIHALFASKSILACAVSRQERAKSTSAIVRKLAGQSGKDPSVLEEPEARAYLLDLKERKNYAPSSMRIAVAALQMFFKDVLGRDWKLFAIVRCPDRQKLPIVLSREEVRRLLAAVYEPRFRVILELIYACGLRVGEAAGLCVRDIHAAESRITSAKPRAARTVTCRCRLRCWLAYASSGRPIATRSWSFRPWVAAGANGRGNVRLEPAKR
jgi:site-specific recombinase XerD